MFLEVPFGEWLPDAPDFRNPGCLVADGVYPVLGGYKPIPQLVNESRSATGAAAGSVMLRDNSRNTVIVGGTDNRLFVLRTAMIEQTGFTSIGSGEAWDFCQFNDFVIATGANNVPQYLTDIDSDNSWSDLSGTAPEAKRCAKVLDFLMLGSVSGVPNRIQWSPFNSPTGTWTASADRLTQASSADLPLEFGEVQRIVGGRSAIVFQERGISVLQYVGPPVVWSRTLISNDRGAVAPFSVVTAGEITFFLGQDGFYMTNGSAVPPISNRKVSEWFFENVNQRLIATVQGAIDWHNQSIVWSFPSRSSGLRNRLLIFNWSENRWSTARVATDWVLGSQFDGIGLEDLTALYGTLEAIPVPLDSPQFSYRDNALAAFVTVGSSTVYHSFTGLPMEAMIETGLVQLAPARRVFVSEVHPLIETTDWGVQVAVRQQSGRGADAVTDYAETGINGSAPVRAEGQKLGFCLRIPADNPWTRAQGVQIQAREGGYR